MKTVKKMSMGGSLKDVPAGKKGLAELPTKVRNKMGYKKNGGSTDPKMKMGGIVKAQYGKEAQEKIAKELGDRRPSDMIEKSKSKNVDGKMGQVLFIKLPAKKIIDPHEDHGDYLHCVARYHIPIITNLGVKFIIDGESKHVPEGECWEINNNKTHAVENNGEEDRIHLLIDIMPNKYLTV
jgi:hypothetical protein